MTPQQRWRATNPERAREQWRRSKLAKMERLAGCSKPAECEVCGLDGKICYDHDHRTGKFRGWLCNDCNLILGKADDNALLLRRLAHYLETAS